MRNKKYPLTLGQALAILQIGLPVDSVRGEFDVEARRIANDLVWEIGTKARMRLRDLFEAEPRCPHCKKPLQGAPL